MTYEQLITLESIVTQGSFKSASQILYKSQPSLSVAIKNLEQEFNIQLFDRSGYRPILTKEGQAFYTKAKRALEKMRELDQFAQEMGMGVEPEISMSIDGIAPLDLLLSSLKDFFDDHPSTSLNLSVDYLSGTTEKIRENKIDIGITQILDPELPITSKHFVDINMIPVCTKKFITAKSSLSQLKKLPQVIVKDSSLKSEISAGLLDGARQWHVTDMQTKYEIIKNGLGWGRLPKHMIDEDLKNKTLIKVPLKSLTTKKVSLYIIRHNKRALGPVAKELLRNF